MENTNNSKSARRKLFFTRCVVFALLLLMLLPMLCSFVPLKAYAADGSIMLKAGTYRFNPVLTEVYPLEQGFDFIIYLDDETFSVGGIIYTSYTLDAQSQTNLFVMSITTEDEEMVPFYINPVPDQPTFYKELYPNGWMGGNILTIHIPQDVAVGYNLWYMNSQNIATHPTVWVQLLIKSRLIGWQYFDYSYTTRCSGWL